MKLKSSPLDKTVGVNGMKLHYLDWGNENAPDMFLLHGFSGHAHAWDFFASSMCDRYHIVALDQRGHGDSDWSSDGYNHSAYVADVESFVDRVGLRKFLLIGHSMGGMNAIAYAGRHTVEVDKLVIVDIGPDVAEAGIRRIKTASRDPKEEFDSPEDAITLARSQNPRANPEMLAHRTVHAIKPLAGGKWTWKYDKKLRQPGALASVGASDLWDVLPRITCPTLIVRGELSDILSRETAEKMQRVVPNARLVEVAGAGHTVPLDNPEGFEEAVMEFLVP